MIQKIKRILAILIAISFVVTLTTTAVSAATVSTRPPAPIPPATVTGGTSNVGWQTCGGVGGPIPPVWLEIENGGTPNGHLITSGGVFGGPAPSFTGFGVTAPSFTAPPIDVTVV